VAASPQASRPDRLDRLDTLVHARRAVVGGREEPVTLGIKDGVIVDLAPYAARADADVVVEIGDDEVLLPGLVDTHVHVNEPGRTEWEGFATATRAAAAGGVTTIVDMPLNSIPPTTTVAALETKQAAAGGQAFVDVGFWGGAVPGNVADLAGLHEAGVFGFKCFLLDSGVEEFPHLTRAEFLDAMAETSRLGALMIVHAEDADAIEHLDHGRAYSAFLSSRPPAAEERAIDLVIEGSRTSGSRAHVVHLSASAAIPALRGARADGVDVSVETCPHYLVFDAAEIPDGATEFKCCPPIRDADNREGLWEGLVDGDIDFVVSDHSPCTAELKRRDVGDFSGAWGGIASLQLGLPAVWTTARERGIGLAAVVGWMATAPARRVGLVDKGEIAVGGAADLCVFAPDEEFVVDVATLHHKNPVSAYAGRTLTGTVRQTWLHGRPIDLAADPRGRLLRRGD
jgi:allantoinase